VGIGRRTFYRWRDEDEDFREKVEDIHEAVIDWTESQLRKSIKSGQYIPAIFYLKTQGKKRGYIEKTEHEHSGAMTFEISEKFLPKEEKE